MLFKCRADRLKVACIMYVLQNSAIALSALSALAGLHLTQSSPAFWAAAVLTIGSGSVSSVGAQGSTLSVEKEWAATLCHGDSLALALLNSGMSCSTASYHMTSENLLLFLVLSFAERRATFP